jgi:RsiW-degrading membrane proteinase PrsW (M82 family)
MIYGASVGAGFASLENMLYLFYGNPSSIPLALLARVTTTFCQIAWTAIAARTLGLALALRGNMKVTDLLPGLLVVIPLHFLWNSFPDFMRGWFMLPIMLLILFREVNMAVNDEVSWGFKLVGPNANRVRRRNLYEQVRHGK